MKKWEILNQFKVQSSKFKVEKLVKLLLENRGIKTKKETEEFLNPKLENVTIENVDIDKKQLKKSVGRIKKAIDSKEKIVIYGDYDVDGVCATAILWETLHEIGADVTPYIPHRIEEGYGLSIKGIQNLESGIKNVNIIVTVDNGIVANEAVEFANKNGIDVIITDHHVKPEKLPDAYSIIHTTNLCGAGVAWALAQEFKIQNSRLAAKRAKFKIDGEEKDQHLELVALATIADMVSLLGANRILAKFGLEALRKTKRVGLLELFKEAALDKSLIGVYEIGHVIAPRLNAMGRLEFAMDSLRLLCTKDRMRAFVLADKLGKTNKDRQTLTLDTSLHAKSIVQEYIQSTNKSKNLLFVADETYQPGVIGLVAGKLVEEFYRPAIVVSIGEKFSKASARSISGFNIIEFIRSASEHLIDCGGHPMAAGFTVETEKLIMLRETLEKLAEGMLDDEKLKRVIKIDCEIPADVVGQELYDEIQKLSPFGVGNPEPVFMSKGLVIQDMRIVGHEGKHVKFRFKVNNSRLQTPERSNGGQANLTIYDGIAFGMGNRAKDFHIGEKVDVAYAITENVWNGNRNIQLKIKDAKAAI